MIIIILGPQGSGKGTQAKLLAKQFKLNFISMGDILRSLAERDRDIADKINNGILLSDKEVIDSLQKYLTDNGIKDNIIFDGVPRRVSQYQELKKLVGDINMAILLEVGRPESIRRLAARRQDPVTGEIYNLITNPPPKEIDLSKLIHREDDKPSSIELRLKEYEEDTKPLLDELKKDGILKPVNGERSIEEIHQDLVAIIASKFDVKN